jgi:hypothetical protein
LRSYNLNVVGMVSRFMKSINIGDIRPVDDFDSFLIAIGLCNHQMFFPASSRLENLFSSGLSNDHDLLIKYRCLKYCSGFEPAAHKDALVNHMSMFGYTEGEIGRTVNALIAAPRCLLESTIGNNYESLKTLRVTYAGAFYLNKLLYYITYLQIVSDDIILPDGIVINKGSWGERVDNMIRFLSVLGGREIDEASRFFSAGEYGIQQIREYSEVYSSIPLAVHILGSLKGFISGRMSRTGVSLEGGEAVEFQQKIDDLQHDLTQRFRDIMRSPVINNA